MVVRTLSYRLPSKRVVIADADEAAISKLLECPDVDAAYPFPVIDPKKQDPIR